MQVHNIPTPPYGKETMRAHSFILIVAAIMAWTNASALDRAMIGKSAPEFTLRTLDGSKSYSLSDFRGSVVLVDFWASWCAPCKRSLPRLAQIERSHKNVRVVTINIDDDRGNALSFFRRLNIPILSLFDPEKTVAAKYDVPEMPSALIVDKSGVVRYVHVGYSDSSFDTIVKHIEALQ